MRRLQILLGLSFFFLVTHAQDGTTNAVAKGKMPDMVKDKSNTIHVVYGTGDSIMYVRSKDGKRFSAPALVAVLPKLFASAMRGPQIAAADNGIVVTACTKTGDIFSFNEDANGKWTKASKVNDESETAKEALMSLSADGQITYAVWLGVRKPKGQDVWGARSNDGGKTWNKNVVVYTSPDGSVCECCKPSVVVKDGKVYVMFRNWLKGSRDLYLAGSSNGGSTFAQAQKLGTGSWKLNGCPMDGGGLVIDVNGNPETVWRRESKIYTSSPGHAEKEIGEGKGCTVEMVNGKKVYAWADNGAIIIRKPEGGKISVGKGNLPHLKALNAKQVVCLWENDNLIQAAVVEL